MSATVETSTASWRKRRCEDDKTPSDLKRPRYYYYRLESESSRASEEDTESVYSLQGRETDVVRDTTDTESKSDCSDQDEYAVIEYEVASLSESENGFAHSNSSSGSEGMMLAAAAAVMCDSSLETWITDCEESDNSSLEDTSLGKTDFTTCVQCKSENDNPLYRYCEKCFQSCRQCKMRKTFKCFPLCISCYKDRKKHFPPRPRRKRKLSKSKKKSQLPVKLDTLRSCLSGLSQDSGIGSSQECPPLDLHKIVVPGEHLIQGTSRISTVSENGEDILEKNVELRDVATSNVETDVKESSTLVEEVKKAESSSSCSFSYANTKLGSTRKRKRQISESSLSDFDVKRTKKNEAKARLKESMVSEKQVSLSQSSDVGSEISSKSLSSLIVDGSKSSVSDNSELCIFCNNAPKDSIFLHTNIAHQCCCYRCAKRTLNTLKRCPICNRSVNKVVKIYTA